MTATLPEFLTLPDLANRDLAGSVVWATDESFAERENLIMPHEPLFDPTAFGNKGKVYDGWETRRRRHSEIGGHDSAIVRLGVPGHVKGVVVDTAWFTGNFPPGVAVYGLTCDEFLSGRELAALPADAWFPLVEPSTAQGNRKHYFETDDSRRVTHVRLDMLPDGGIARLRVHGIPAPDPRFLDGTIDLAAMENGARVTECSNMFYSSPNQVIGLGRARNMGGGWENARRREPGEDGTSLDYLTVQLAAEGRVRWIEVDTSYFVFNAPGDISVVGVTADGSEIGLIPTTSVLPDTRHRLLVEPGAPVTAVRLNVYPDGGLARLRVWGELTDAGMEAIASRW